MKELSSDLNAMFDEVHVSKAKDLSTKLQEKSADLVGELVKYSSDQLYELKVILLLKDPNTGTEIQPYEITNYLANLPFHILGIHSQYLQTKFEREKLDELIDTELSKLRAKAEEDIIVSRMAHKANGFAVSGFGAITKENLLDKCKTYPDYSNIVMLNEKLYQLKYKEEFLKKLVDVAENRRYELGKILDVSLHGV
jgi:hypothetical protein